MAHDDDFDRPGPPRRDPEALRRLVRYQRWLIAVVLAQLVLWLGFVTLTALGRDPDFEAAMSFAAILTLILGCVGAVFVFLAAWELRGPFAAAVFGLAAVVPCVGLLVITLVNGYATAELKAGGVAVGLFGASLADVEERNARLYDDEDAGW